MKKNENIGEHRISKAKQYEEALDRHWNNGLGMLRGASSDEINQIDMPQAISRATGMGPEVK